jgi:deoxycytidylate deaminase
MQLAIRMAEKSPSRFRLGAVLAYRNQVLSTGHNNMGRTHPLQQKFARDRSFALGLHAEVDACLGVAEADLDGADLYVARILKDGRVAMAKSCAVCIKFMKDVGIHRVYFTNENGNLEVLW